MKGHPDFSKWTVGNLVYALSQFEGDVMTILANLDSIPVSMIDRALELIEAASGLRWMIRERVEAGEMLEEDDQAVVEAFDTMLEQFMQ